MKPLTDKTKVSLTIATMISVITFIIYTTYIVTKDRETLVARISGIELKVDSNRIDIDTLISDNNNKSITLAEINVRLANIELLLTEVKKSLK